MAQLCDGYLPVSKKALANCSPSLNVLSIILKFEVLERKSPTDSYGVRLCKGFSVETAVPLTVVLSPHIMMVFRCRKGRSVT